MSRTYKVRKNKSSYLDTSGNKGGRNTLSSNNNNNNGSDKNIN